MMDGFPHQNAVNCQARNEGCAIQHNGCLDQIKFESELYLAVANINQTNFGHNNGIEQSQKPVAIPACHLPETAFQHHAEVGNDKPSIEVWCGDSSSSHTASNVIHSTLIKTQGSVPAPACGVTEIHSGIKKFACTLCSNSYTQKHNLTKHMRTHTGEKPYQCNLCEKAFYVHHHLKNHMLQHGGQLPFVCSICNKRFRNKSLFKAHVQTHNEQPSDRNNMKTPSMFGSDGNSASVFDLDTFVEEEDEDTEGDSVLYDLLDAEEHTYDAHDCSLCRQMFVSQQSLENHMRVQHSIVQDFKCDTCDKSFQTKESLEQHYKNHAVQQVYSCEECNVSFRWKVSLHIHMRRHNNDYQKYKCTLCEKYFLAKESLKKHINFHFGINAFVCVNCGEKFYQKTDYMDHQQMHAEASGVKIKAIPTCKTYCKTFSSNSSLRKHEYTHLEVKPHKCEICDVSFAQKIQLQLHSKKHNGNEMIPESGSTVKEEVRATKEFTDNNHNAQEGINIMESGKVVLERTPKLVKLIKIDPEEDGSSEEDGISEEDGSSEEDKWTVSIVSKISEY